MLDLSDHVRLRFTGNDRVRYLNGQVTNDVRKISTTSALWACITNHKGKLEALVTIHDGGDGAIYLDGPPELREFLPGRLARYIIADDVVLEDVSESTVQAHFLEEKPVLPEGFRAVACSRLGVPGWDVWGPAEKGDELFALEPALSPETEERMRIAHGIPGWATELARDILPPEAGLETWAVDYHKGCYIGQEVISRLKSVGRVNRQLQCFVLESGPELEAGWLIFPAESPESEPPKSCGEITSAIWHPELEKSVALGYVRREQIASGNRFLAGPDADCLHSRIAIRNT